MLNRIQMKAKRLKNSCMLALGILFTLSVSGQSFRYGMSYGLQESKNGLFIGGGGGILDMDGDYGTQQLGAYTAGLSMVTEYKFNNYFVLRGALSGGTLRERFAGKWAHFDHYTPFVSGELFGMFLCPSLNGCRSRMQVRPYIGFGLGVIGFETYANLFDPLGQKYHFWTDGTTRMASEFSIEAENAQPVIRDKDFETRVDSMGLISGIAGTLPAEVGFRIMFNENIGFYLGGRYTLTTTDHIDHGVAYGDAFLTDRARQNLFPDGFFTYSLTLIYRMNADLGGQNYSRKLRRPVQCRKF